MPVTAVRSASTSGKLRSREWARITLATAWKGQSSLVSPPMVSNFSGCPWSGPPFGRRVRVFGSD